jgi:hypothetical protein
MEYYYFYNTPKPLQKIKIHTNDIVDVLCPFFIKYTNQPLEIIKFDYNYYIENNESYIIENIKILENNLKIYKNEHFSNMRRYEISVNSYIDFIKILRERKISFNGISIYHNFNFLKYNYKLFNSIINSKNNLFNNIFVGIGDEKSQYASLTLNIPLEYTINENKEYLKNIENEIKIKISNKHFYEIYKNENTNSWKSRKSEIIM